MTAISIFWLFFLCAFIYLIPIIPWVRGRKAGIQISLLNLLAMRLRKTPPSLFVDNAIRLHKNGLDFQMDRMEAHYLAGGNVNKVVDALIKAKSNSVDLSFKEAAAKDLVADISPYRK